MCLQCNYIYETEALGLLVEKKQKTFFIALWNENIDATQTIADVGFRAAQLVFEKTRKAG